MERIEERILNAFCGAVAVYNEEYKTFCFQYCPEKVVQFLGYDMPYFDMHFRKDALGLLCDEDRAEVERAVMSAKSRHIGIKVYSPVKKKSSCLKWYKIEGWEEGERYYLLFGGMSQETQMFHTIAGENADSIYVIDKENHNLLYVNGFKRAFWNEDGQNAPKCYEHIYGKKNPCPQCTMKLCSSGEMPGEMNYEEEGRWYAARFKEAEWNGVPAYIKYVRDITEEVNVKREKERLEKYFETVLKYLPGGVAVVHRALNGGMTPEYLSDGFADMVGMSMDEAWDMYKQDALSGVHPDDQDYVKQELDRCIRENCDRKDLQYRLKKGNGGYIWVNTKLSVIQCEAGDAMVYADYHDITEEREAQEKLRRQYREQIFQHYLITDPNTLILGHCNITKNKIIEIEDRTNSRLLERFGDNREEFFTGIGTLVVEEEERRLFYEKYLNEPSVRAFEKGIREVLLPCLVKLPDCSQGRYVQFKVNLVETPDTGDITGILTVTDITEKTIQERIIRMLSSLNYDLVADVDLINDKYKIVSGGDLNIKEVQGSLLERVKRVAEELTVDTEKAYVRDMLDPEKMIIRLKDRGTYSFRYSVKNESDEIQTKNMIVSAIDLSIGRICLVRTDVTDMLAAERKVKYDLEKALSEAEKASRVKSDFLSSMSHDIRTPMNAIVGMTTLAQANLSNPQKVEDYLKKISISSQHLLSLINDILDMNQIEQSKLHMNVQSIHMDELLSEICTIMASTSKAAGLEFTVERGEIQHMYFQGDALRIKQILINILSNAFKFTMEGGRVLFRTEEIPSSANGKARYRFIISDTGIGMSQEFINHLFEPFCRSERVNRVEGTGLGLSITKGLIDFMGGRIHVKSRPDQGTVFVVELEFTAEAEKRKCLSEAEECIAKESLEGRHFLVAEDNAINSEILEELLHMWGATCVLKENGLQAADEFENSAPGTYDAILMDIQMPVMNGYEAARRIRSSSHLEAKTIVILAMTADAFSEDVQKSIRAGMNAHISKPVDMKILYNTLIKLLDD